MCLLCDLKTWLIPKGIIVIAVLVMFIVLLFSGCINEEGKTVTQEGKITYLEHDVPFGFTFTGWQTEVLFDDGSYYRVTKGDVNILELNRTGIFRFKENFYEDSDGYVYELYTLISVDYYEDEY